MNEDSSKDIRFNLNREEIALKMDPSVTLLSVLRNQLRTTSPRYGCGQEQCGACKVIVDGKLVHACTATIGEVHGKAVTTLEGLADGDGLHEIQEAFIAENAGQCGYCLSGVILSAKILLAENPSPSRQDIQNALDDHLCRCGAHNRMIKAIQRVAGNRHG